MIKLIIMELNKDTDVELNKIYTYKGKKYVAVKESFWCSECAFVGKIHDINKGVVECLVNHKFKCMTTTKTFIFLSFDKIEELQNEILKYDETFSRKFEQRYFYYPVDKFHQSLFNSFLSKKLSRKQAFYMAIRIIRQGSDIDKIKKNR